MNLKYSLLVFAVLISITKFTFSKVPDGTPIEVNIFLDTRGIDVTHLRQEIKHVNYARTSESSNVHLINNVERTGGAGRGAPAAARSPRAGRDGRRPRSAAGRGRTPLPPRRPRPGSG